MLTKLNKKRDENGFTLIELMIVIAIIGILAAIAIPQFAAYRERAFISALESDAHTLANAQESYYVDFDSYSIRLFKHFPDAGIYGSAAGTEPAKSLAEGLAEYMGENDIQSVERLVGMAREENRVCVETA